MPAANRFHPNLVFAYLTLFYLGLADNLRGPVFPELLEKFQLTSSQGAWYFAASSIMSFFAAALVPRLTARVGYKRALQLSIALMALSQLVSAVAPSFAFFIISSIALGTAIGFLGVLQNVMVLVASRPKNRARLSGGLHANYAGSSILAPLLVGALAMSGLAFQVNFWFSFLAGVLIFVAVSRVQAFEMPSDHAAPLHESRKQTLHPEVLFVAVILSTYVAAEILVSSRLSQFAREHLGWSIAESSQLTLQFFVGMFAGRMGLFLLPAKFEARRWLIVALALSFVLGILGVLVHPLFYLALGVTLGPIYPLTMTVLSELFPQNLQSATTAAVVGSGLSVVLMHLGVGWISDFSGVRTAMFLEPLLLGLPLVMILLHPWLFGRRGVDS